MQMTPIPRWEPVVREKIDCIIHNARLIQRKCSVCYETAKTLSTSQFLFLLNLPIGVICRDCIDWYEYTSSESTRVRHNRQRFFSRSKARDA